MFNRSTASTYRALCLLLGAACLITAQAQVFTTTLDVLDGDTLVLSTGTNARGLATTATISIITLGAGGVGVVPTRATTALTTPLTTTPTRAGAGGLGGDEVAPPTTTARQVVQGDTLPPPQKTFSYVMGNCEYGLCTSFTWTAAVTELPTLATALVAQGTQQNYEQYQSAVNGRVFEDAKEKEDAKVAAAGGTPVIGAAGRRYVGVEGAVSVAGVMAGWAVVIGLL